jgi:hypothetical protein|eukprot:COSAG01_NODE_1673_length_9542_cov_12.825765_6_plen_161_part_00
MSVQETDVRDDRPSHQLQQVRQPATDCSSAHASASRISTAGHTTDTCSTPPLRTSHEHLLHHHGAAPLGRRLMSIWRLSNRIHVNTCFIITNDWYQLDNPATDSAPAPVHSPACDAHYDSLLPSSISTDSRHDITSAMDFDRSCGRARVVRRHTAHCTMG